MFLFIIINVFYVINVKGQLCDSDLRIDLTDSDVFSDGSAVQDGIRFPAEYIFSLNVSGDLRTFGCPCKFKNCFRKCCPLGHVLFHKSCVDLYDPIDSEGLKLYYMNSYKRTVNLSKSDEFAVLSGLPCDGDVFIEDDGPWYVQEDGSLYVEMPTSISRWSTFSPDRYCIDNFVHEVNGKHISELNALVCFDQEPTDTASYIPSIICMLISCVFILATVAVYCCLPELCNLHGRVLIAYLLCLFVGFVFLSTMKILLHMDNITRHCCMVFTFIIYYFLLAAFFWLNIMCFDIWWTFSGNRGMSRERSSAQSRFRAYAAYAMGVPTLLTILVASLQFSNLPKHPLLPLLTEHGCFMGGTSRLLYLYGPMTLICISNMVFFILTTLKITSLKSETSVLKSKESATHDRHNKDKQRLFLYVKLFIVMGVNWLLEVISALYPDANNVWKFTDAYNVLVGLLIFILFVCKKKIFRLLKKRVKDRLHGRNTDFRNTSRTNGSRSNIQMEQRHRCSSDSIKTNGTALPTIS